MYLVADLVSLSKTFTCTLDLNKRESIDHLCINPILCIGLIHKLFIDYKSLISCKQNTTSLSLLAGRTVDDNEETKVKVQT